MKLSKLPENGAPPSLDSLPAQAPAPPQSPTSRTVDGLELTPTFKKADLDRFLDIGSLRPGVGRVAEPGLVTGVEQLLDHLALEDLKQDPGFKSKEEAEMRALMPERFKIIDQLLAGR